MSLSFLEQIQLPSSQRSFLDFQIDLVDPGFRARVLIGKLAGYYSWQVSAFFQLTWAVDLEAFYDLAC